MSEETREGDRPDATWVRDHAARAIERAKLLPEPFPHCFVQNVFPEIYYREMLAMPPAEQDWNKEDFPNLVLYLNQPLEHLEPKYRDF